MKWLKLYFQETIINGLTLLSPFMVSFGANNIISSLYGEFWCQQYYYLPSWWVLVPTTLLPPFMVSVGANSIITSLYGEIWWQQHYYLPLWWVLVPTTCTLSNQASQTWTVQRIYAFHTLVKNISLITLISISDYTILSVKNGLLELQNCLKIVPQELWLFIRICVLYFQFVGATEIKRKVWDKRYIQILCMIM